MKGKISGKAYLHYLQQTGAGFVNMKAQEEIVLNLRKFHNYFKNLAMCRVGGGFAGKEEVGREK
jgi:hypothetical protein